MDNYYTILEINESASAEVIKAAYRALVKKYHPDNYSGDNSNREKKLVEINEAYEVLSDETKRKIYDNNLKVNSQDEYKPKEGAKTTSTKQTNFSERKNESKSHFITDFLKYVGKETISSINEANRRFSNTYLEGMYLDERTLVYRYKASTGYKRAGYAKALEERGFFYKNVEGHYIPTNKFKEYY